MTNLQPVLENIIGIYNHKINLMVDGVTPYGGISSLDFGYISRFIIICITLKFAYKLLYSVINSMFRVRGKNE